MSAENANKAPAFQLKASLYTLTTLHLLTADLDALHEQLMKLRRQAPKFLNNAPIIIDLQRFPQDETSLALDFAILHKLLSQHELIVVGLRHVPEGLIESAKTAGFAILPNAGASRSTGAHSTELGAAKPLNEKDIKKADELGKPVTKIEPVQEVVSAAPAQSTMVITKPVRSGQQIYAKDADLIVIGIVSPGAEIMADGNIHVYGVLRGRALAGAKGNTAARIFCQQLAPELISVAGNYWLIDDVLERNRSNGPVQIYLQNDQLRLESLG